MQGLRPPQLILFDVRLSPKAKGHSERTERHGGSGNPPQPIEPAADHEVTHHLSAVHEQHEHDHDRRSQYAVDDSAPVESFDRIERNEVERYAETSRHQENAVERHGLPRLAREPDRPFPALTD